MSRNTDSDENGRFYKILLTNLTKFLFLWKFAHKLRFNRLEGPRKIWRKPRIWQNLIKAVDKMLQANILTRLERAPKKLAKTAHLARVAILAKFGQGC